MRLIGTSLIALFALLNLAHSEEEVKDWLEFYYEDPKPAEYIAQVKLWEKNGLLRNFDIQPTLIAFTSQVMRQNRDKIQPWWLKMKDMAPEDRVFYSTALMFARVTEADKIIEDTLGDKYSEFEPPPKILEIALDRTATINMLWGYFYATGSENAIRRILKCFLFEDAPENPEGVDVPEGYHPYYKELPRLAYVSLVSNLERHPKLVEICENILATDKKLYDLERINLYDLLSEVKPEKYPIREELKK